MIQNLNRHTIIASRVEMAQDPWSRVKGLLGKKDLPADHALIITQCQSIHMLFMMFPIDVIFCNSQDKVVGLCMDIKPFTFSPLFFTASYAIELPAGVITVSKTQAGDQLKIQ